MAQEEEMLFVRCASCGAAVKRERDPAYKVFKWICERCQKALREGSGER
jgi:endogenous inhibitor of DNA gyrase (YacG/DUF329 family)